MHDYDTTLLTLSCTCNLTESCLMRYCILTHFCNFAPLPIHRTCSNTDGMEVRSVGNSQVLKETALIEAFNLKAAIEFVMKNVDAAKEALTDMPPRTEEELDPVRIDGRI